MWTPRPLESNLSFYVGLGLLLPFGDRKPHPEQVPRDQWRGTCFGKICLGPWCGTRRRDLQAGLRPPHHGEPHAKLAAPHFRERRQGSRLAEVALLQTTTAFPGLCCSLFLFQCPAPPPTGAPGQQSFPARLLCKEGLEAEVEGGGSELALALFSCTCRFSSTLSYTW